MDKRIDVELSPVFCIVLAMMLLTIPLQWLFAAIIAATFHELCHCAAVSLFHGNIHGLKLNATGAKLDVSMLSRSQELLCALAGPIGGLFLLLFVRWIPRIAICAAFHSLYNLLPIYPLDGGRAVWCAATIFLPKKHAEGFCRSVEIICFLTMLVIAIYASIGLRLGLFPFLPVFLILIRGKNRNTPCKRRSQRVQ